jgi:hypothetical protein
MQKHKYINSKDFLKACRICDYSELNPIHFQPSLNKECKCTEDTIMGDCPVHRPNTSQPTEKPMEQPNKWESPAYLQRHFKLEYVYACNLKSYIKDLLKEEREAYEDTIQILQEPETMKKIRQTRIKVAKYEAVAEYKQKLIKEIVNSLQLWFEAHDRQDKGFKSDDLVKWLMEGVKNNG